MSTKNAFRPRKGMPTKEDLKKPAGRLWMILRMHFPGLWDARSSDEVERMLNAMSCADCEDYKIGECEGKYSHNSAGHIVECMGSKADVVEFIVGP